MVGKMINENGKVWISAPWKNASYFNTKEFSHFYSIGFPNRILIFSSYLPSQKRKVTKLCYNKQECKYFKPGQNCFLGNLSNIISQRVSSLSESFTLFSVLKSKIKLRISCLHLKETILVYYPSKRWANEDQEMED